MKKEELRIVFMGTPEFAVESLKALVEGNYNVAGVITMPDKPAGRGHKIQYSAVKEYALSQNLPVLQPEKLKEEAFLDELRNLKADLQIVVAFRMLPEVVWNMPKFGTFNLHASLLPQYRGAAPINWAIINGERETGATLHEMLEKPDAGGIVAQQAVPILPDDTALDVFNKVTLAAEMALDRILPDLLAGRAAARPQDLAAGSYFGGRKAEDGRIDWSRPAAEVHNLIRAVAPPYPGAFSDTAQGRLDVLRSLHPTGESGPHDGRPTLFARDGRLYAECGDGRLLRLLAVELEGSALAAAPASDQINAIIGSTLPLS